MMSYAVLHRLHAAKLCRGAASEQPKHLPPLRLLPAIHTSTKVNDSTRYIVLCAALNGQACQVVSNILRILSKLEVPPAGLHHLLIAQHIPACSPCYTI